MENKNIKPENTNVTSTNAPEQKNKGKDKPKTLKSQVLSIPVRVEIKPDGRLVWDVNSVHKTIAKEALKNKNLQGAKLLVKKDSSSINLAELASKVSASSNSQNIETGEAAQEAATENV